MLCKHMDNVAQFTKPASLLSSPRTLYAVAMSPWEPVQCPRCSDWLRAGHRRVLLRVSVRARFPPRYVVQTGSRSIGRRIQLVSGATSAEYNCWNAKLSYLRLIARARKHGSIHTLSIHLHGLVFDQWNLTTTSTFALCEIFPMFSPEHATTSQWV